VVVTHQGGQPVSVPLAVEISPLTFPQKPALHLGGWDYTDSNVLGVTDTNREALIRHLQDRFVDSPWATNAVWPKGTFGPGGTMAPPSTQVFDTWVGRWPNASRYCIFANVPDSMAGAALGTALFNARVQAWTDFWVDHAGKKGIKPEQIVLLLVDEPKSDSQGRIVDAWAKAIKATQPRVVLWENPTYERPWEGMPEIFSAVDVLTPNRNQMIWSGKNFAGFYREQRDAGRRLELYSCLSQMHLLDPYAYVRLQAWTAWDMGAEGSTFWSFSDNGRGSLWRQYAQAKANFSPLFLDADSVTPAKHAEAMRESVEDYEYFVMLKKALAQANPGNPGISRANELLANGAQRVLAAPGADKMQWIEPKDRWEAELVRLEILKTLETLQR
jgi:hypothetical protein